MIFTIKVKTNFRSFIFQKLKTVDSNDICSVKTMFACWAYKIHNLIVTIQIIMDVFRYNFKIPELSQRKCFPKIKY